VSNPTRRVRILWTTTAKECLKALAPKVQRGLIEKADELEDCSDPKSAHKPLVGPLKGYYRITYSRYRAVYRVDEEPIANGDVLVTITVTFVACGKREEHSREDVYRVAQKLVETGIIDGPDDWKKSPDAQEDRPKPPPHKPRRPKRD
jgi:mRNA-degrading endonuclease RelE of RelBE toxin-antitoxin system